MTKEETIQKAVDQIVKEAGAIHGMVCNAGRTKHKAALDFTTEEIEQLWGVNVSPFFLNMWYRGDRIMKAEVKGGKGSSCANIVVVIWNVLLGARSSPRIHQAQHQGLNRLHRVHGIIPSQQSKSPFPPSIYKQPPFHPSLPLAHRLTPTQRVPSAPYGASKAGIRNMVHTLAMEWAPHSIRVNSVSPGLVKTAMTYWVEQQPDWEQQLKYYGGMPRLAEVEELGGAYVYLLSDAASYTTSIDIPVNGVIGIC